MSIRYKRNRIITIALFIVLIVSIAALTAEEAKASSATVYVTLSSDGEFIKGTDGTVLAHVPVKVDYFDLKDYGLDKYYRYEAADYDDGGRYINDNLIETPTLLHLYMKLVGDYYLGKPLEKKDIGTNAFDPTGSATSCYLKHFWGHDENLMYLVNHEYPLMRAGTGATCDYILLSDGDEIDLAMYTDWTFYTDAAFGYFSKSTVTTNVGSVIDLSLLGTKTKEDVNGKSTSGMALANETIRVSSDAGGTWEQTGISTDDNGEFTISFDKAGTYYISAGPTYKTYKYVAPPICVVTVQDSGESGDDDDETEAERKAREERERREKEEEERKASERKTAAHIASAKACKVKVSAKAVKAKGKAKKSKRRSAKVSWKKPLIKYSANGASYTAGVTGYKIYRAAKKSGKYKLVKTIKKAGTTKWTDKKLKKGRKYFYKVRPFTKISGKIYLGKWSNAAAVKTK